jgi:hypothetical protein
MFIEIDEKLLDELKYTAGQLANKQAKDNDIETACILLTMIAESVEKGPEVRSKVINREGHTHVILTSFCLSNEWLGDK